MPTITKAGLSSRTLWPGHGQDDTRAREYIRTLCVDRPRFTQHGSKQKHERPRGVAEEDDRPRSASGI